jgi:sugar O-acyltransferase (sialic acid O-acetyltransferase NeuD family)
VVFLVDEINRLKPEWRILGFLTNRAELVGQRFGAYSILDTDDGFAGREQRCALAIAVGNPGIVRAVHDRLRRNAGFTFPNLIHPAASGDWRRICFGTGNIVLNGVAFTSEIKIGSFNQFNPGSTVAHDCRIGDYSVICPGAHLCGAVQIEDEVYVGAGATVIQGLRVARSAMVGAGAVVVRDIVEAGTYAGVPACKL